MTGARLLLRLGVCSINDKKAFLLGKFSLCCLIKFLEKLESHFGKLKFERVNATYSLPSLPKRVL